MTRGENRDTYKIYKYISRKDLYIEDKTMVQKITLSIPDLLHEKLKEWRNSFNFSKMFQEALTEAIQKKEDFQKRFSEDFEMPEIIKRLQHEKVLWEKQFFKSGKKEGMKWARSAHYEDLLHVVNMNDTYKLTEDPKMKAYFEEVYDTYALAKNTIEGSIDHQLLFIDGWLTGVNGLWNQVKEKI